MDYVAAAVSAEGTGRAVLGVRISIAPNRACSRPCVCASRALL